MDNLLRGDKLGRRRVHHLNGISSGVACRNRLAVTLVIIMKEPSSTISGHKSEAEPVDRASGNHP